MPIPTEPIGSIPRPVRLIEAIAERGSDDPSLEPLYQESIRDTIERFEATGSPVITGIRPSRRSARASSARGWRRMRLE